MPRLFLEACVLARLCHGNIFQHLRFSHNYMDIANLLKRSYLKGRESWNLALYLLLYFCLYSNPTNFGGYEGFPVFRHTMSWVLTVIWLKFKAIMIACWYWGKLKKASVLFIGLFLKAQRVCPFHDGWFMRAPAHTPLSVQQFLTQNDMAPVPQILYSPDLTLKTSFCFPGWKKFSKGNVLPIWKRWNKKTTEALKGIKTDEFKNCFEPWEKISW